MPTIFLRTPVVFRLPSDNVEMSKVFDDCSLMWDEECLFVKPKQSQNAIVMPALRHRAWLKDCLKQSPVKEVYLDPGLDLSTLKAWADICQATGKRNYLNVPANPDLPQERKPIFWKIKRMADWIVAVFLLCVLSPLMLLVAGIVWIDSRGPILFSQWRVGYGGRLFRIYKFRSMRDGAEDMYQDLLSKLEGQEKADEEQRMTRIGRWLRQSRLNKLPELVNVLRGEMSLVGLKPWTLQESVTIAPDQQRRLNALPGITWTWQISNNSRIRDLKSLISLDLAYLEKWMLLKDLRVLTLTVPKVFVGIMTFD